MSHWAEQFVGRPFTKEYDCAAFVKDVMLLQFNEDISIPTTRFTGIRGPTRQIDSLKDELANQIDKAFEGCAVLMVSRGSLYHIGVYCDIKGDPYVLHNLRGSGSVLSKIRSLESLNIRVEGYYRWT